ncbi:MAG: type II toxin-antitoxin system RelE/ParE family toxin [Gammaproteobacteria bacterium]
MTVSVHLRPEAEKIWRMRQRGMRRSVPGSGKNFWDEALATFSALAETPLIHVVIHRTVRRALLHRFPFGVFYEIDDAGVVVIAVLHGSRHPDHWQGRD